MKMASRVPAVDPLAVLEVGDGGIRHADFDAAAFKEEGLGVCNPDLSPATCQEVRHTRSASHTGHGRQGHPPGAEARAQGESTHRSSIQRKGRAA